MRTRIAASMLVMALSACSGVSSPPRHDVPETLPEFSIRQLPASPSPLRVEVQAGDVQGLIPEDWQAQPLPQTRYPQQGFIASPSLADWDTGAGIVRGMEAFWVDVGKLQIPSDYYYLVARGPAIASLAGNSACHPAKDEVFVDHPPDLTGHRFSPSDYVESATGMCKVQGQRTRWAYIVAAPGFGPAREVGLPSSGLYVVLAVVSGKRANALLHQIIQAARFGEVPISKIVAAVRTA